MTERPEFVEIEARAQAATPGPWSWFGNTDNNDFYLATRHSGRRYVMSFRRAGMQGAQPEFQDYSGPYGRMTPAKELAIYQVAPDATSRHDPRFNVYRGDIIGFRNPDAEFIAHARQDVEMLLGRIKELEAAALPEGRTAVDADDLRLIFAMRDGCAGDHFAAEERLMAAVKEGS